MSDTTDNSNKLRRFDNYTIDKKNPWESNLVPDRQVLAETLTRQFKASGGPYVLSISSGWGTGKSDFLERWQHWLHHSPKRKKAQGLCFRFNAWEYDYTQDPFLAFAMALQAFIKNNQPTLLKKINQAANDLVKELGTFVLCAGTKVLPHLIKPLVMLSTPNGSIDPLAADFLGNIFFDAAKGLEKDLPKFLEDIEKNKTSRDAVKKAMAIFGKSVSSAYEGMPLIIMVDELDRCKPSFAVAVLETIKHLFCVKNTVFVLAIEQTQIANCIAKTYGLGRAGSKAYLHKFIDMDIHLPAMDMHSFICQKFNEPQFALGIGQNTKDSLAEYSFSIPEWIAAITYEILPSCREALQVMNQVAVLSYRNNIDYISLLACAYAMSYKAMRNYSISKAVEEALTPIPFSKLMHFGSTLQSDKILQYKNIFNGIKKTKNSPQRTTFQNTYLGMASTPPARNSPHPYLLETGYYFCDSGLSGYLWQSNYSAKEYSWKSPCGEEWRKQLEEFINFVEPSKEEGTPL